MIDSALATFLQEGLAIHIGTRNEHLEPNGARGIAVTVDDDGTRVVVYVSKIAAERLLADLRSNGRAAVVFCRPTDDRACQVKGVFVSVRQARTAERALMTRQWEGFVRQLGQIGIPPATVQSWATWPAVAITLRVTELFDQTPGPKAGTALR
jgi:hypothetical protein